jgi:hypothetical protein
MHGAINRGIEMHDLSTGMHQSIGSSRATQGYRNTACDFSQGFFQRFLNRRHARTLTLKTAIP